LAGYELVRLPSTSEEFADPYREGVAGGQATQSESVAAAAHPLAERQSLGRKASDGEPRQMDAGSRFWVGYGDGGLAAIEPESGKQTAGVKLDAHPESFQLETKGTRIFVNVPNAGHVAVVDRMTGTVIEKIPL
jgi:hypothetical protein